MITGEEVGKAPTASWFLVRAKARAFGPHFNGPHFKRVAAARTRRQDSREPILGIVNAQNGNEIRDGNDAEV